MVDKISLFSSVATLILFAFYFIGRIITIVSVKRIWNDKVILNAHNYEEYEIIDDVVVGENSTVCYGILLSKGGIRDLKVYDVAYDKDNLPTKKEKLLYTNPFINIDHAIAFCVETGDLFPTLIIEYTTFDYMKVRIEWRDNLKSGVFGEFIQPRHTLKSFCYYLFR